VAKLNANIFVTTLNVNISVNSEFMKNAVLAEFMKNMDHELRLRRSPFPDIPGLLLLWAFYKQKEMFCLTNINWSRMAG